MKFKAGEADVEVSFTMGLEVSADVNNTGVVKSVFYDEIPIVTTFNMRADDDIAYITILENKLNIDSRFGHEVAPKRTSLDITESEYREFISSFGFYLNYLRKYLNNVYFKNGLWLPYNPEEIYTTVFFKEQSMHIFLDLAD